MYIYQINVGNVSYYGKAVDIPARMSVHLSTLKRNKHHNRWLQNSYNKYRNFKYAILAEGLTEQEANDMEIKLIAENRCCNLTRGGDGHLGKILSDDNKAKMQSGTREWERLRKIERLERILAVAR